MGSDLTDFASPGIAIVVRQEVDVDASSGCQVSVQEEKPGCIV